VIRLARPGDRERLRELQSHLREPNPPLLDYAIDGPPLVLVSSAAASRTGGNGTPVGYLVVFYSDEAAYVAELAVAPEHRREGRARRLLVAAFDHLREEGCSRIRLAVHPDNEPARRLYESLGFEEVGREEEYYADGSEALVMGRDL
jgi:ribosomal-protein-alanine N-acetyltransferase